MKLLKGKDYKEMSILAANCISAQVIAKPDSILGLATGSTPIGTYEELVRRYQNELLDFKHIVSINLDEYRNLEKEHPQSYHYFMNDHLFSKVNIKLENTFVPDGSEPDMKKACEQYDEVIDSYHGIDLQLLGLGNNGHIGFNEPADSFCQTTPCVDLTESTIEANARFFETKSEVPTQAYTMGIKTIMQAKKVVLVVSGAGKAEIVKKAFFGPVTPQVPASILQFHPDFTLIGDADAFALI